MTSPRVDRRLGSWKPVYDYLLSQLGPERATVLSVMAWHARGDYGYCNVSADHLAQQCGLSIWVLTAHRRWLVQEGWLEDLTPNTRRFTHHYRPTTKCAAPVRVERPLSIREQHARYILGGGE